jgi:hypothetical protein
MSNASECTWYTDSEKRDLRRVVTLAALFFKKMAPKGQFRGNWSYSLI